MSAVTESKSAADLRREVNERERELGAKQNQLAALYRAAKNDAGQWACTDHQAEQIRALEAQCASLTDKANAVKMDWMAARNEEALARRESEPVGDAPIFDGSGGSDTTAAVKGLSSRPPDDLGEAFVASGAYKNWNHGGQAQAAHIEVDALGWRNYAMKEAIKATLTTSGFTSIQKQPETIVLGQQMLTVADLFANAQTNATTIRYIQEDTFTNAATTVAEEGTKPEASWDLSEVDAVVRKIAVYTKVTDETFEDYPQIRDYINQRLPFMVRQREELQLLAGDGIAPNLLGVLNVTGVLTQAMAGDTPIDAIYKGITKVRTTGFFEPDAVVIDPTNWTPIRLAKTTTGEYIYGDPYVPGPETIFGKRVVVTVNMTDNTALVGAFRVGGTVFYKSGIRVEATNSDQADFINNRIALRAEQRETLAVWRPTAFCKVTGLTAG